MAETAEGGVYLNASGEGYHDANGKPVEAGKVAEAEKLQREQSQAKTATLTPIPSQSNEALAAAMRSLLVPQQPVRDMPQSANMRPIGMNREGNLAQETQATPMPPQTAVATSSTERLVTESEQRAKGGR